MNVSTATIRELVRFYNEHSGKPAIKKFRDRLTAEARVLALLPKAPPVAVVEPAKPAVVGPVRPFQAAKAVVAECIAAGLTARKEIIKVGLSKGIKYNTIDAAHYELCVRKS